MCVYAVHGVIFFKKHQKEIKLRELLKTILRIIFLFEDVFVYVWPCQVCAYIG